MAEKSDPEIEIVGARTNNLKNVSIRIPHNKFIVVTGVSGSGKSSLVFDILAKEGQRRYFETLPSFARQFLGKLNRPEVDEINGLSPVITVGQRSSGMHARATVGTMSDIYDLLRLLFARTGTTERDIKLSRALFSFNSDAGKCPQCKGIGQEEKIDLEKLIVHPEKTIREGALAPTLPTGYIMYSQVTIDVLNQVCEAEGFNVDIPWKDLTEAQQNVVLYGSDKIKVPFGKHSLESRLKWTGIKAKPREEGHYKGLLPIMSDILRRDRNANILKYVHAVTCSACHGARLNEDALSVQVNCKTIAELSAFEVGELHSWIESNTWGPIGNEIVSKIAAQLKVLRDLGLGHLALDRPANTLRSSEIQRIRLANQILVPLSDVLYVFDEPSIGLHPEETARMIAHFKSLVAKGNTVIVVEHDLHTIRSAKHIIEIGPKAGIEGGEILFNGTLTDFLKAENLAPKSPTYRALQKSIVPQTPDSNNGQSLKLKDCHARNLKHIDVEFQIGKLNVVSGKSGAGKSTLVKELLRKAVESSLAGTNESIKGLGEARHLELIDKLIFVDHKPIGKTPRSNPATYLGLSDFIRDLFAKLPESKAAGFSKSRFSFNNKGGRCETCQGAGKIQIGMHFLGNVDLVCGTCNGDRFNPETLAIKYKGKSIADVYRMSVESALEFFEGEKKLVNGLQILKDIGLGYLTLGQSSTTLSGGEAQRIKIANQLQKKDTGNTLYIIIEPSIGLHRNDVQSLMGLFTRIKEQGNTIVCIEQDEAIIAQSDWHLILGPEGGAGGGEIIYQGIPKRPEAFRELEFQQELDLSPSENICLNGVTTHGLKNIDVTIPKNQMTVVTGLSGSGKSSLVFDTLFAEANARFTESLSAYNRSFLQQNSTARLESFSGLGPAIGIRRKKGSISKRSTVGTASGVYDAFRLLYARIAQLEGKPYTAQHFSYNHHLGACPACQGMGVQVRCNPDELIVDPYRSILDGALAANKALAYYWDVHGQFMATLNTVATENNWDISTTWNELTDNQRTIILYGTGDTEYDVTWEFNTKTRSGTQQIKAKWLGLCNYIDDEYQRRLHNKNIQNLEALMHDVQCPTCAGSRLKPALLETKLLDLDIHALTQLNMDACLIVLDQASSIKDTQIRSIADVVLPPVEKSMRTLQKLGLGHLNLNRPMTTLSGGEAQRVRLAGQLSSHLFGVTYVLDEPTIGLDSNQIQVLISVLKQLTSNGNTVVVVEHDADFIQQADYLIEMGPGSGMAGGQVMFQGIPTALAENPDLLTNKMLQHIEDAVQAIPREQMGMFGVKGAIANNLKGIDVDFNLGQLIAVTGVSGSGKSSLVKEVLYPSWVRKKPVQCKEAFGLNQFEQVLLIDQQQLYQNRLSTPATITGIIDGLKAVFAKTETATERALKRTDFSYLSKKGKCPTCGGHGQLKTSMDFMSDVWLQCHTCNGMRYSAEVLECLYKGKSIGEVLQMTIDEAATFFEEKKLLEQLSLMRDLGLGHLVLGQSGHTLSGGESQRLKLAVSLLEKRKGDTLYLFDEPSTGLHYFDVLKLVQVFNSLVDRGDTVLFIEHNKTLIQAANQIITLGPGSGEEGGKILGRLL